jgi:hypothetical protein
MSRVDPSSISLPRGLRLVRAALPVSLVGAALVLACGSRGPLDEDGPLDAGSAADVVTVEPDDAAPPPDAASVDAAPEGGSIVGCGTCLVKACSQDIVQCVQEPGCRATFQCVITDCLKSGAPDAACMFTCASGDAKGALQIVQILQCVTGTCGTDCNPVLAGALGALGGLGGGGGGGGGRPSSQGIPLAKVDASRDL